MFTRLNIKEWRQFSDVDIVFHNHLTVLTGANGAGKTTIVNLLMRFYEINSGEITIDGVNIQNI